MKPCCRKSAPSASGTGGTGGAAEVDMDMQHLRKGGSPREASPMSEHLLMLLKAIICDSWASHRANLLRRGG
eukprot:scaffold24295_cov54-Phaeocystis_antarctica.AAC.1